MLKVALKAIRPVSKSFFTPLPRTFSEILIKNNSQIHQFKAQTKQLLDIVAKSLYMDKEVFVRQLVSNASDALEKKRFQTTSGESQLAQVLRISIKTNETQRTISIRDNGIGMTSEELKDNLGTIAYSGTANFLSQKTQNNNSIIGQFGVGFYSCFIVADEVQVISRPEKQEKAFMWASKGLGEFQISELDQDYPVGTQVKIFLKEDCSQFARDAMINRIVKKYSNYLSYPIEVNENQSNIQPPIWTRNKKEVSQQEYKDFFEYFTSQKIPYKYKFHISLDMPLQVKALFFIPSTHKQKFGLSQEQGEIDLYSKKVLIRPKSRDLLPNWMRFMKGVVDCQDIPLNVSRQTHQDSELMGRLNNILSKSLIKSLVQESKRNQEMYSNWFENFGNFIVEGMITDLTNSRQIAPLARYHWSEDQSMVSLDTYLQKISSNQKKIYYLFTPNREYGLSSPYMELFFLKKIPVIFSFHHVEEMIFRSLEKYKGFKFINIEHPIEKLEEEEIQVEKGVKTVPEIDLLTFTEWVKNELQPYVKKVVVSKRLRDSPAIVTGDMPHALRQLYRVMEAEKQKSGSFIKDQVLEINVNHEIIVNLNQLRRMDPQLASDIIAHVFDNALLRAGIFDNAINIAKRINKLLTRVSKN